MVLDFHTYVQPQSFLDRLRKRTTYPRIEAVEGRESIVSGPGTARPVRPEQNDIERRLTLMDEAGIDCQILRLQHVSGVDAFEAAEGSEIAQASNEDLAELAVRFPGRFLPFAAVTMRDPQRAADELERAVTKLGHLGVGLSASCEGKMLDAPEFEPILEMASKLRVPIFVLPNHPSVIDAAIEPFDWLSGALGFQVDLSVVALRLLCAGPLDRYPDLHIVLANLGGIFPFTVQRLDHFWERMSGKTKPLPVAPSQALRRFSLTTSSASSAAIEMCVKTVGTASLLFGSDYPSCGLQDAVRAVQTCEISESDRKAILGMNAQRLLRLH